MYFINVLLIFNYWYVKVHINCISVYKKDLIMLNWQILRHCMIWTIIAKLEILMKQMFIHLTPADINKLAWYQHVVVQFLNC